jgi:hypothetical protein
MWGDALEGWLARDTALRRYGPWVALAIAAAAYYRRFAKDAVGMVLYPQGGDCVLHGAPLAQCADIFSYPPVFAFVMAPFAALPMGPRIAIWYLISLAATFGCYAISEKLVRKLLPGRWREVELAWLRIVSFILTIKFVLAVFEYQAYDTLAYFFVLAGLWAVVINRAVLGGLTLGFAAAIKATPLVFMPYLVVKRRFLAAAVFTVALIVLSFVPDIYGALKDMHTNYFVAWTKQIAGPALSGEQNPGAVFWKGWMGVNLLNQSMRGMVARLVVDTSAVVHAQAIYYALAATLIAFVGLLLLRSSRGERFPAIEASILVISMLMLSPMTSRYHYVLMILPYMTITGIAVRDASLRAAAIATLIVSFVLGSATSNDLVGQFLTEWSYAHNFLPLSALVLLPFLAYMILRKDTAPELA